MTGARATSADIPTHLAAALDYEAPFLEQKLFKDRVVDGAEEARALFLEVKRYLVLGEIDETTIWTMFSLRVDEAWHQFVLFTVEYTKFCDKYFGRYIHHSPANAPESAGRESPRATFAEFAQRYRTVFGTDLPDVWDDSTTVRPDRRVFNNYCGQLELESIDSRVELSGPNGAPLLRVRDIAAEALRFIASTGAFYVREMPGELTDTEKVRLASALVHMNVLRAG